MDTTDFREWYASKVEIADQIIKSHERQGEPDAEILLCCANSALAAQMWPGEGIDKKRFVQFLVQFSDASLSLQRISIPLLANRLEAKGDLDTAIKVRRTFLPVMPIMLNGDVDKDEETVRMEFPSLTRKEIRSCSYASSIYVDLRSGLVHEYQLSSHLIPYTLSDRTDIPSYVNLRDTTLDPTTGSIIVGGETRRYLHFPYQYIRKALASSAESAFRHWDTCTPWNQPEPQSWWVEV